MDVHVVTYEASRGNREHKSLLISEGDSNVGTAVQVMGDKRYKMMFDTREVDLNKTKRLTRKERVGVCYDAKSVIDFCSKITPPFPEVRNEDGSLRDCQDWVAEAIDRLKEATIIF